MQAAVTHAVEATQRTARRTQQRVQRTTQRTMQVTQKSVLPITITCTVALSSGSAAFAGGGQARTRAGSSAHHGEAIGRVRERSVKPQRRVHRPTHRSARPRSRAFRRAARTEAQQAKRAAQQAKDSARTRVRTAKDALRRGRAQEAARHVAGKPKHRLGVRERFALWRTQRKVHRAARKMARRGGRTGDLRQVSDAVAALDTLQEGSKIGAYRRWRAGVARRRGFRTAAIVAAKKGDFDTAREALARARKVTGTRGEIGQFLGRRGDRRAARRAYDKALRLASGWARGARPDLVQEASDFAGEIAVEGGLRGRARRHERQSAKLLETAKRNLVSGLQAEARELYFFGELDKATEALDEADDVSVKLSRGQRRHQQTLRKWIAKGPPPERSSLWRSAPSRGMGAESRSTVRSFGSSASSGGGGAAGGGVH